MKKAFLIPVFVLMMALVSFAQSYTELMLQPKHVTARKINPSGETTTEYTADFFYGSDGKLLAFSFPTWNMNTSFQYDDSNLTLASTSHTGCDLYYFDSYQFIYDGDLLMSEKHLWDYMNADECYDYYYNDYGRLIRKQRVDPITGPQGYWEYEYDDTLWTKTSYLHGQYVNPESMWSWGILQITYYQYDEAYTLLSEQTDVIDPNSGETTKSDRILYAYTPSGRLESVIKQTFTDGVWINNNLELCVFDDNGNLVEQHFGQWSDELNDWNITFKIVHSFDESTMLYTLSFFKKSSNDWIWGAFGYQTLFFEPELTWQQKCLEQMIYDDCQTPTMMAQIELTMEYTPKPSYMAIDESNDNEFFSISPVPSTGVFFVTGENLKHIDIFDALGKQVASLSTQGNQTSIDLSQQPAGIYFVNVTDNNGRKHAKKIIKQ